MDKNQSVSLGCGTLILIALIVLMFSNPSNQRVGNDLRELRSEVRELKSLVQQQTDAIKFWQKLATLLDPPDRAVSPSLGPYARAEWHYFASEYAEAAEAYRQALANGLDEAKTKDAYFKTARSLHQGGRYREAVGAYEDFIRRYPTSDEANRAQGHIELIRQNRALSEQ